MGDGRGRLDGASKFQPHRGSCGKCRQGVVNVEEADKWRAHKVTSPFGVETEDGSRCGKGDVTSPEIAIASLPISDDRHARDPVDQPVSIAVIRIDDSASLFNFLRGKLREEQRLSGEVLLHCPVIIKVILRKVCEDRSVEFHTSHPLLYQSMTGNLQRGRPKPPVSHPCEHVFQFNGFRGCAPSRFGESRQHIFNRSDQTACAADCITEMADDPGCRGLSIGAGNSGHSKRTGGKTVIGSRQIGHCRACIFDTDHGDRKSCNLLLSNHCKSTSFNSLTDKYPPVFKLSRKSKEEIPGGKSPRVVTETFHLPLGTSRHGDDLGVSKESLQRDPNG